MKATLAVVIMAVMALMGFFVGCFITNSEESTVCIAILFALISGIGCIIQAINNKPHDEEK